MITKQSICGRFPIKPLADVAEFLDSRRRPITAADREPGPYPYFGANGQQDSVADFIFDEPLILLAEDGGLFDQPDRGIAYAIGGKTWVNNHAHVLRPRKGVELRFLLRVLENYDVTPWITGSTRAKLTKAGASEIQIPLPPLAEQKRIAGILDAADALRAKRRESFAHLDSLLQSTFLTLFGDPVSNPMGWDTTVLEDFAHKVTDGDHHTPERTDSGIKLLSARNVLDGEIDLSNTDFVGTAEYERMIKRCHPERGDVLISCSGSIGRVSRIQFDEPVVLVRSAALVKIDHSKAVSEFVEHLLRTPALKAAMLRAARSVAQANLFQKPIRNLPVFAPPLPLQRRFAAIVESVERQKARQRAHLAELDSLFASLQHRAFRGEL